MTILQRWMKKHGKGDAEIARAAHCSRVQISRIRRGKSATSVKTAIKLQLLTGIQWHKFLK